MGAGSDLVRGPGVRPSLRWVGKVVWLGAGQECLAWQHAWLGRTASCGWIGKGLAAPRAGMKPWAVGRGVKAPECTQALQTIILISASANRNVT